MGNSLDDAYSAYESALTRWLNTPPPPLELRLPFMLFKWMVGDWALQHLKAFQYLHLKDIETYLICMDARHYILLRNGIVEDIALKSDVFMDYDEIDDEFVPAFSEPVPREVVLHLVGNRIRTIYKAHEISRRLNPKSRFH